MQFKIGDTMEYEEQVKLRMLKGDLSKPEDLYPLLIKQLSARKKVVKTFLKAYLKGLDINQSILDVGGAAGHMVEGLDIKTKVVIDKRVFQPLDGISYLNGVYMDFMSKGYEVVLFSEFLHLFSDEDIEGFLENCKAKKAIVVIENQFDDFLDLRLRLWSNGRCLENNYISKILKTEPSTMDGYNIWVKIL